MIRLTLLGSLDLVAADGRVVRSVLSQPKRLAVLAYLAVARPCGYQQRDSLLALFWSTRDNDSARNALNRSVYHLRQSLGADAIDSRGSELGLQADAFWCDVQAFEAALAGGRLEAALELYRGDLLEGFNVSDAPEFERWLDLRRAELRVAAAGAAGELCDRAAAGGRWAEAAGWGERAAALSPLDEAVYRRWIDALSRSGNRAAALSVYDDFTAKLHSALGVEPAPETRDLALSIREASGAEPLRGAAGPAPTLAAAGTPLPAASAAAERADQLEPARGPVRGTGARTWRRVAAAGAAMAAAIAVLIASEGQPVVMMDVASLQVDGLATMETVPRGYREGVLVLGGMKIGERFVGQALRTDSIYDVLAPSAANPLYPEAGTSGRNLFRGKHSIQGPNLSGVGPDGIRGGGSLAIYFETDQGEIGLSTARTDGGSATFAFFRRDGSLIDTLVITELRNQTYAFRRRGPADIAGVSIHNRDPRHGIAIREIRYAAPAGLGQPNPNRVAIFPFQMSGAGDPGLGSTISRMLIASLDGAGEIRAADPHGDGADGADAAAPGAPVLAARAGAQRYVLGSGLAIGDRIHLRAALHDSGGIVASARAQVEGPADALVGLIEELARQILAGSLEDTGQPVAVLAAHSTRSLPALRAFLTGRAALYNGQYPRAVSTLETAVAADPGFALAHLELSEAALRAHRPAQAHAAARAAERHSSGLPPETRRRIAAWSAFLAGEVESAVHAYRVLLSAEPDDLDAWFHLGATLLDGVPGSGDEAQRALEKVLQYDVDHFGALARLARIAAQEGDSGRMEHYAKRALSLDPALWLGIEMGGLVYLATGDSSARADVVSALRLADPAVRDTARARLVRYHGNSSAVRALVGPAEAITTSDRKESPGPQRGDGHVRSGFTRPGGGS